MINKQAHFTPEQFDQMLQLEKSIQHWSLEQSKMALQIKGMLENIEGLYMARQNLLADAYQAAGIQPGSVVQSRISKDGTIQVICNDDPAPPAGDPANGAEASANGAEASANGAVSATDPAPPEAPVPPTPETKSTDS